MATRWIDAAFVRGGTSKGLCFSAADLPGGLALPGGSGSNEDQLRERDAVLCAAMGSPDRFGRQLDGMGGGISSLSKAMIVDRSTRDGVDLDYTFAQVEIGEARVDYSGNCGNLSSAVVPFALAAGLIAAEDGPREFTLFNTNTESVVVVRLTVVDGQAAVQGELELPGVDGRASPIELVYPAPGGSRTGGLLPTGNPVDTLAAAGREVPVSLVDAAIPLVLVNAGELGLRGTEAPAELDSDSALMALLESLRCAGAVRMGLCDDPDRAPLAVPKITIVTAPADTQLLDGTVLPAAHVDVLVRPISMGQAHRAVPGTGAMCLAAAAQLDGTVVAEITGVARVGAGTVRLGTPSGVVTASAVVDPRPAEGGAGNTNGVRSGPRALEAGLVRTARLLMRGQVAVEL